MPKLNLKVLLLRQQKLIFGFITLVALIAWVMHFVLPQQGRWVENRVKIQQLQAQVNAGRQKLSQLPRIESDIERLSALYTVPDVRPLEEQIPQLLELITQDARVTNIRLMAVKPPKGDLSRLLTPGSSGFIEVPIQVEATGGYYEISHFLHNLETSEILVRVKILQIERSASVGKERDYWHHKVTMSLDAYLAPQTLRPSP